MSDKQREQARERKRRQRERQRKRGLVTIDVTIHQSRVDEARKANQQFREPK